MPNAHLLVLGANSAIVGPVLFEWARRGAVFCLVGRTRWKLSRLRDGLIAAGSPRVEIFELDLENLVACGEVREQLLQRFSYFSHVLFAQGLFFSPKSATEVETLFQVNLLGIIHWTEDLLVHLPSDQSTQFVFFSSIAGDRGKARNLVYGTTKAALNHYVEGLRHRCRKMKRQFVLCKLGNIRSPMTRAIATESPLWSEPEDVAPRIVAAMDRAPAVIYVPGYWRILMTGVRSLPRWLFLRRSW